jgi:hypothetical protein
VGDRKLGGHAAMQESVPKYQGQYDPKNSYHRGDPFGWHAAFRQKFNVPGLKEINPEKHKQRN